MQINAKMGKMNRGQHNNNTNMFAVAEREKNEIAVTREAAMGIGGFCKMGSNTFSLISAFQAV